LATSIGEGDAALVGGVVWLPIRELLLGVMAVAGGFAGLMKRSDVRRPPYHMKVKHFIHITQTGEDKISVSDKQLQYRDN
jgi:hypothetical protein